MGAFIETISVKIKSVLNPYLYNNGVSPMLGLLEHILHMDRSFIALSI